MFVLSTWQLWINRSCVFLCSWIQGCWWVTIWMWTSPCTLLLLKSDEVMLFCVFYLKHFTAYTSLKNVGFYMDCVQRSTYVLDPLSMSRFTENGSECIFSLSLSKWASEFLKWVADYTSVSGALHEHCKFCYYLNLHISFVICSFKMYTTTGDMFQKYFKYSALTKRMWWEWKIDVVEFYDGNNKVGKVYSLQYTVIPEELFTCALLSVMPLTYVKKWQLIIKTTLHLLSNHFLVLTCLSS